MIFLFSQIAGLSLGRKKLLCRSAVHYRSVMECNRHTSRAGMIPASPPPMRTWAYGGRYSAGSRYNLRREEGETGGGYRKPSADTGIYSWCRSYAIFG
jgi:hypothetical protein